MVFFHCHHPGRYSFDHYDGRAAAAETEDQLLPNHVYPEGLDVHRPCRVLYRTLIGVFSPHIGTNNRLLYLFLGLC